MNGTDYFFIVGCPRSGTTLLSVLLDRHTRLCVTPETAFFDEVAPQLTDNDREHLRTILRNWKRLTELNLEADTILARLREHRWNPSEVLVAIMEEYAKNQGKLRCGEKTPQHLAHVPSILQQLPGAKIICLLRDGRDVALSLNSMPWWDPRNLVDAAEMWKMSVQLMDTYTHQYPAQFKVVKYEKLITAPKETLVATMNFLGERLESNQFRIDIPSNVVLPRSMEWKGKALGQIEYDSAYHRRSDRASKNILTLLEQMMANDLRNHGYDTE